MRDNLSVILAVIMGVIVIVFIPVITVLQYQNNVAYNLALSLTTEFVEGIKQNGKISAEEYETFLEKLRTTSNSFNVELEARRYQMVKGTDENGTPIVEELQRPADVNGDGVKVEGEVENYNSSIEYTEENLIDFTDEILQELYVGSDKNNNGTIEADEKGTYPFEKNDEIYVNVYNTNVTMLDRFTSAVFGTQIVNPKKVNISLGGKIFGTTQTSFMQTDFANAYAPSVIIDIPNGTGVGFVWQTEKIQIGQLESSKEEYKKAVLSRIDSEMYFCVTIRNAKNFFRNTKYNFEDENGEFRKSEILSRGEFNDYILKTIPDFIQTNDFTATDIRIVYGGYTPEKDELVFKFYLSGIYLSNYEPDAFFSITIKPGLVAGVGNSLSASVTSEQFLIDVPNEDGPPKIHLSPLPEKIVEGDFIEFTLSATDMSGISYFNFDETWIKGIGYTRIDLIKNSKNQYRVFIYGIKEDDKEDPNDNKIILPAGAAMDYENNYNDEEILKIGKIDKDTQKPEVSLTYKINDQNKNQIETGDKFTLEIKIQDNSNSWIPNWLTMSNVASLRNAIQFHQGYDEVKTVSGDTLNSKLDIIDMKYDIESRIATIILEIPSFPEVAPAKNGGQAFTITIPSGVVKDLANNSNNAYTSQYITYNYFVAYITHLADGNNLKITVETPKKIANIDELEASNVVTLHHATADSITITKIDDKSFEINILNIQVSPDMMASARVEINKEVLKSEANELLPKSTKTRYLNSIPNLNLP